MYAHIRNGQIINQFRDLRGWVTLENGDKMSPPVVGTYGEDKIVPVVVDNQDTSTGTVPTTVEDTGFTVEPDRVYRLVTTRDMTPAELDAFNTTRAVKEVDKVLGDIQRRALNVLFDTINTVRTNAGQQPITLQQYVAALDGADVPITRQQFVDYVKGKL